MIVGDGQNGTGYTTIDSWNPSGTHGTVVWSWQAGEVTSFDPNIHGGPPAKGAFHVKTWRHTDTHAHSVSQEVQAVYAVPSVSIIDLISGALKGEPAEPCLMTDTINITAWAGGARVEGYIEGC